LRAEAVLFWHKERALAREKATHRRGHTVTPAPAVPSPLSPHWAFVVQFRLGADVAQGPCAGRVEHVVSGQAAHFQSVEELLAFMARVLATVRTPPRRRPRGG